MVLHVKVGNPHLINVHFLIYTIDNFFSFSSYLLPWVVFSSSVIIYKLNVLFTSINTNKNKLNNHDKSGTSNFVTSSMMNKLTKSIDGSIISERLIDSPVENDIITPYEQFISRQKTLVVSSFDNMCMYIYTYLHVICSHTYLHDIHYCTYLCWYECTYQCPTTYSRSYKCVCAYQWEGNMDAINNQVFAYSVVRNAIWSLDW